MLKIVLLNPAPVSRLLVVSDERDKVGAEVKPLVQPARHAESRVGPDSAVLVEQENPALYKIFI